MGWSPTCPSQQCVGDNGFSPPRNSLAGSVSGMLWLLHYHEGNVAPKSMQIYSGIKTSRSKRNNCVEVESLSLQPGFSPTPVFPQPGKTASQRMKHTVLQFWCPCYRIQEVQRETLKYPEEPLPQTQSCMDTSTQGLVITTSCKFMLITVR